MSADRETAAVPAGGAEPTADREVDVAPTADREVDVAPTADREADVAPTADREADVAEPTADREPGDPAPCADREPDVAVPAADREPAAAPGTSAPPGTEAADRNRQPWLHRLEVAVHGNTTALSAFDGTMSGATDALAATGLFVDDRRVLSSLDVTVDGVPPEAVAADSEGGVSSFRLMARNVGDPGPDPTVEVTRIRTLEDSGMTEEIQVTSRAGGRVELDLAATLAGDGAEVHEVKSGRAHSLPTLSAERDDDSRAHWADERHRTELEAVGDGGRLDVHEDRVVARWRIGLDPGDGARVGVRVRSSRRQETPFDADPGATLVDWGGFALRSQDPRLEATVAHAMRDLRALLLRDPDAPEDAFAAAGTPWYLTLFGRDSIWAARMSLPWGTGLAGGTLRALARRQGRRHDVETAEEPGKILHEVRRSTFHDPGVFHLPPTYYGTVDATPLWVCLLHDAWRWGLPADQVGALHGPLLAALGWMRSTAKASPDGLIRYFDSSGSGLSNQGWKDSGDAMRDAQGGIAPGPIALLETQAYAVEAARGAADLLERVWGEDGAEWREWAGRLTERVASRYWVDGADGPFPAIAIDGRGRPVDGVGSNMGHALGTGVFDAAQEAAVARLLASPQMSSRFGVRTLSADNPAYNPLGYHTGSVWIHDTAICAHGLARSGHRAEALALVEKLVATAAAAGYRWPELCGAEPVGAVPVPYPASCRPQAWAAASAGLLVSTLLGLRVDVPGGVVELSPLAGAPFGALEVTGLRVGAGALDVQLDGTGAVVHVRVEDPAVRVAGSPAGR